VLNKIHKYDLHY